MFVLLSKNEFNENGNFCQPGERMDFLNRLIREDRVERQILMSARELLPGIQ